MSYFARISVLGRIAPRFPDGGGALSGLYPW